MPPKGKVKDDKSMCHLQPSEHHSAPRHQANAAAFGMKNKNKSSKVQKFVKQVEQQQAQAGKNKETVSCCQWQVANNP